MEKEKSFIQKLNDDENFLVLVHWIEKIVAKALSLGLIFIVLVSLGDLIIYLAQDTFSEKA